MRYPMCEDQLAQIDCRKEDCKYYDGGGVCKNASPAITLTERECICWSFKAKKTNTSKSKEPFVEVIRCKECGNVFAGCVNGYQNDEHRESRAEYLAFGHKVEFVQNSKAQVWNCNHPKTNEQVMKRAQKVINFPKINKK